VGLYERSCKEQGITVLSLVCSQLHQPMLRLNKCYLGNVGGLALAEALKVFLY
jgi:hypothetical protein